jgi:hypothetical protein
MRNIFAALVISFFSAAAFAAGSPLNEDFTELLGISDKILEASKNLNGNAVSELAEQGLAVAKDQGMKGQSPKLQRVSERLKAAKKAGKKDDFEKVNTVINEAIAEMNKPVPKPNFGGGSEQTSYKFGTD